MKPILLDSLIRSGVLLGASRCIPRPMWLRLRTVVYLPALLLLSWLVLFAGSFVLLELRWVLFPPVWVVLVVGSIFVCPAAVRRRVAKFENEVRADDYARCLQCGYPLRGLPPIHQCPECGVAYELKAVRRAWAEVLDDELADAPEEHRWECPRCGQRVPRDFEICWNCESSRPRAPAPRIPPGAT